MGIIKEELKDIVNKIINLAGYSPEIAGEEVKNLVRELGNTYFSDLNIVFDFRRDEYTFIYEEAVTKAIGSMPKDFQDRVSYIKNDNDWGEIILSLNDSGITFQPISVI